MWKPTDHEVASAANTFSFFSTEQYTKMYSR